MYRLGRGDHLYTISEMSGLGISTVSSICQEVCQVLVNHLWNETVSTHMPQTGEEFKQKILNIEEFWQFPCCWTAIDGCHIPMKNAHLEDYRHAKSTIILRISTQFQKSLT